MLTMDIDILKKEITIDGIYIYCYTGNFTRSYKHNIFQIWDTPSYERFHFLYKNFYRMADFCILIYDVTCYNSFKNLEKWKNWFLVGVSPEDAEKFPVVLLGNKVDTDAKRCVCT